MKVHVDGPGDIHLRTADSRGRITLGSEFADEKLTIAVLEVHDDDEGGDEQ